MRTGRPTLHEFLERERLLPTDINGTRIDPSTETRRLAMWAGDADGAKPILVGIPFHLVDALGQTTRRRYATTPSPDRHRSSMAVSSLFLGWSKPVGRRVEATFADCHALFERREWAVVLRIKALRPDPTAPRWEPLDDAEDGLAIEYDRRGMRLDVLAGRGGRAGLARAMGLLRAMPSEQMPHASALHVMVFEKVPTCLVELVGFDERIARKTVDSGDTQVVVHALVATFSPRCRMGEGYRTVCRDPERSGVTIAMAFTPRSAILSAQATMRRRAEARALRAHLADNGASREAIAAFDRMEGRQALLDALDRTP